MKTLGFDNFLKHSKAQKEVSLAIAANEDGLKNIVANLEAEGFRQAADIADIFKYLGKPSRVFCIVKDKISKEFYDFILQYPTGQVQIYDRFNLKSKVATPDYEKTSIILVATKKALGASRKGGFEILDKSGMAYQG